MMSLSALKSAAASGFSAASNYVASKPELQAAASKLYATGSKLKDETLSLALKAKGEALNTIKQTSITIMAAQITAMFKGLTEVIKAVKDASIEKANLIKEQAEKTAEDFADKVAEAERLYDATVANYTQFLLTFFVNFMQLFEEVIRTVRQGLDDSFDDPTRKLFNKELSKYATTTIKGLGPEQKQIFFVVISMLSDLINPRNPTKIAALDDLNNRLTSVLIVDQQGGRYNQRY
jgi:hypothetical protein